MKRQHTPGPWRIGDARNTVFGPPNGKPSPQTIANLDVIDHEANGRLIAAAPELLKTLITMGRLYSDSHVHEKMGRDVCAMCDVDAAITRATL
jgi:hypothetical protein